MSRTIGVLAVLAATVPCGCEASPPSVRDRVIQVVRARLPDVSIATTDADAFVLKQAGVTRTP